MHCLALFPSEYETSGLQRAHKGHLSYISYWRLWKASESEELESIYSLLHWKTFHISLMSSITGDRCQGNSGLLTRVINDFPSLPSRCAAVLVLSVNTGEWNRAFCNRLQQTLSRSLLWKPCWQQTGEWEGKLESLHSAQHCFHV